MKTSIWLLVMVFFLSVGCTVRQQGSNSRGADGFYTPSGWRRPISKTSAPKATPPPKTSSRQTGKKPIAPPAGNEQMIGYASWYGPGFHGKKTANGEKYNQNLMTAAHRILPMNTWVQVTNLENNSSVVVRINDRGPYKKNRILDLTKRAAEKLGFKDQGTARVSLKVLQYPKDYDPSKGLLPYKQVVIQIAVFKTEKRARSFKDQLARKYHKITFVVDEHQSSTFHVIAGPFNKRSRAVRIAKALKAEGIDNFIRSYKK